MRMTLRLLLAAAAIGAPLLLTSPSGASAAPAAAYQEVAQAGDPAPAVRTPRRTRRASAQTTRRSRQAAHQTTRRARTTTPRQG